MENRPVVRDPLRGKEVALTPEERVRQWFISVLMEESRVPAHMMMSEQAMTYGGKKWRADIVVWDRTGAPAMVVECKRPDVEPDRSVLEQALRYHLRLGVRWIVITNGSKVFVFRRSGEAFVPATALPDYELICQ